jgi:hypothetical protein
MYRVPGVNMINNQTADSWKPLVLFVPPPHIPSLSGQLTAPFLNTFRQQLLAGGIFSILRGRSCEKGQQPGLILSSVVNVWTL